jgi:hypothetical protein
MLSFEALYLEDDIGVDGVFLIEHGVCESGFGDGADFSRDAERDLMNAIESLVIEDRLFCAGQFEVVSDIMPALLRAERGHMVSDGDTLVEGLHDGEVHDSFQIGLSGEDEDERVIGIHFEVGQEPELLQWTGLKEMGLIDDKEDGFPELLFGLQKGLLDLRVDGALGHSVWKAEESVDVKEEIGPAQGGQRGIISVEQVFVEAVDIAPQGECFTDPWISGEKQDASPALDIIEPCQGLIEGLGVEGLGGFDVFVKGESFQSEPC